METYDRLVLAARFLDHRMMAELNQQPDFKIDFEHPEGLPIIVMIREGRDDSVKFLIEHGADINLNINEQTALIESVFYNYAGIIQTLIHAGADVNLHSEIESPLLAACRNANLDIIQLLIAAGA